MIVTNFLFLNNEVLFLLFVIFLSVCFILCSLAHKSFVLNNPGSLIIGGLSLFGTLTFFLILRETHHEAVCEMISFQHSSSRLFHDNFNNTGEGHNTFHRVLHKAIVGLIQSTSFFIFNLSQKPHDWCFKFPASFSKQKSSECSSSTQRRVSWRFHIQKWGGTVSKSQGKDTIPIWCATS